MSSPETGTVHAPAPKHFANRPHLVAYDVRHVKRLGKVHRLVARKTLALQKSVYMYSGNSEQLHDLLRGIKKILEPTEDDLRLYPIGGLSHIWFLSGAPATIATRTKQPKYGWWRRILAGDISS